MCKGLSGLAQLSDCIPTPEGKRVLHRRNKVWFHVLQIDEAPCHLRICMQME